MPAILLFLLAVVLFWPATIGDRVLSAGDIPLFEPPYPAPTAATHPANGLQFDAANVFEPDGLAVRSALRAGRLPLWSSSLSNGRPLLAAQQSAPLFPLTWLGVVFPFFGALVWIAVLKLMLAAFGTYLLARALALRRAPALLGGLTFGFGTYLIVWLMHPHSNAYVLLPWLFLAGDRVAAGRSLRATAALAGLLGLGFLGGQPESGMIVAAATGSWTIYRIRVAGVPPREEVRRAAAAVGALILGLGIAAVMLVPFIESLQQSYHTSRAADPTPLRAALSLFFPDLWGRPDSSGAIFGPSNFAERTVYLGALPILLAVSGLVTRRPRGPRLFFAGMAVAGFAVAFENPVADLIRRLPVLDHVNLTRAVIVSTFAIAMLAAYGCELFLTGTAAERRRMVIVAAAVALVPVLVTLALHPGWLSQGKAAVDQLLDRVGVEPEDAISLAAVIRWTLFSIVAIGVLVVLGRSRRQARALLVAAVALTALDLLLMGAGYNPAITIAQAMPPTPAAVNVLRTLTSTGGQVIGVDALQPNTASRWGLRDARGHEDPALARNSRLWFALGGTIEQASNGVALRDPRTPRLLDVFGVQAVILPSRHDPGVLSGDPVAYRGPDGTVISNPGALPPAFVAYGWRTSRSLDQSLVLTALGTARQARDEPVIETGALGAHPGSGQPATPARVLSHTDTAAAVEVDARAPGYLVFLSTYYPGWRADVDGRSSKIRPANAAFSAVAVPAGRHLVRFSYRPPSATIGGVVTLVALAVLLAGVLAGWARTRRRPVADDGSPTAGPNDSRPERRTDGVIAEGPSAWSGEALSRRADRARGRSARRCSAGRGPRRH